MKALLLTDDRHKMVLAALDALWTDYDVDLDDRGLAAADDHRWTRAEVDAARRDLAPVDLGGLAGVLVTFGDGTTLDTWDNVFGRLARGYHVEVTTTDGETFSGACTSTSEDRTLVVELIDGEGDMTGELAAPDVDDVARIHIY